MKQPELERIIQAIKECFPSTTACDGTLLVSMYRYNKLVEVVNEIANKETQVANLPQEVGSIEKVLP